MAKSDAESTRDQRAGIAVLASFLFVLVAFVSNVIGRLVDALAWIWVSIGASSIAAVLIAVAALLRRRALG